MTSYKLIARAVYGRPPPLPRRQLPWAVSLACRSSSTERSHSTSVL